MYEKVIVITPGRADEFYQRNHDAALFGEIPDQTVEEVVERTGGEYPGFLEKIFGPFNNLRRTVREGEVHQKLGIQWWMWAAIAGLLFVLVLAFLWSRVAAAGYPGLEIVGAKSVFSAGGGEKIQGTIVNSSFAEYTNIIVKASILDSAGQEVLKIEEYIGTVPPQGRHVFQISPKTNLGAAYRFVLDISSTDDGVEIPWWVWVAIGSGVLLLVLVILWMSVSGYRFPGLEIVAAHLEKGEEGSTKVTARLVNYSRRNYERIIVEGAIFDTYDREVEKLNHFVGVIGPKSHREFALTAKSDLPGEYKVKLRLDALA